MTANARLSRDASALFRRFTELSDADQLQTYQVILDYLTSRNIDLKPDPKLEARAGATEAIRRVVEHLGIDDPTKLEVKAFSSAPPEVRQGWTVARVINAHGTWRAAREVAAGERAATTARQRAVQRGRGAQHLRSDDYIAAVRRWLDDAPPRLGTLDYDDWAREWNATRAEGALRVPGYGAIRVALGLHWPVVRQIARGEISLAEAMREPKNVRADGGSGLFVTSIDIRVATGLTDYAVRVLTTSEDFPICVLLYLGNRYWLRSDVKAHLAGEKFPKRKLHELNGKYIGVKEAAKIIGVAHHSTRLLKGMPEPKYRGGRALWLKTDIEAWRDQRIRDDVGRGRWKRKKP